MRKAFLGIAAAILISVASLSTLYARAAWSESRAEGQASQARALAAAAVRRAAAAGLTRSEMRPLRERSAALGRQSAPSGAPFWSSQATTFYQRQASQYRRLARQARSTVRQVTAATRAEAQSTLAKLHRELDRAASLQVDSRPAGTDYSRLGSRLSQSTLPRDYRAVTAATRTSLTALSSADDRVASYASHLAARVQGGQAGVVQQAESESAAAGSKLDLLTLVRPAEAMYRGTLSAQVHAVKAAPSAFPSAVKEYWLQQTIAEVDADYNRYLPQKMIVVSTENQSATMYEAGRQVYSTPVTTGGPELPTDHGVFHIYLKLSPFVFHSPWPIGSPYYYPPTPVQFWMPFDGGEGLHDASWRSNFGPGSNLQPTDLGTGNYILGTHGCVNLPFDAASFVWSWAPVGTTVVVI